MALKNGMFEKYVQQREVVNAPQNSSVNSKYSHNRVFDEPESLKKIIDGMAQTVSKPMKLTNKCLDKEADSIGFNRIQTVSNETALIGFNRVQTVSNQTASIGFKRFQTVSSETGANGFKRLQTVSQTVSNKPSLSEIKILFYLNQNQNVEGICIVQRSQIAEAVLLKMAGVKTGLTRLKTKGYITLQACARGRYTGYTSYRLTDQALKYLSHSEALSALGFKRFQTVSQTVSTFPISSSNNNNTTTTSLPDEWKKINFELLQDIGFSETQLRQLHDSKMTTPEIVQDAINLFAYSLEHNAKVKGYRDPLNVLMGVLRKGQRWNEPNYISPKELALRHILEEQKKRKEQYDSMIKQLVDLEFPKWRKKLNDEEIKKIVPADILKMNIRAPTQSALRTYFIENILSPRLEKNEI